MASRFLLAWSMLHFGCCSSARSVPLTVDDDVIAHCMNLTHNGCHQHEATFCDPNPSLKQVLVVGDSVSMGYSPLLLQLLEDEAEIRHIGQTAPQLENCTGTQLDDGCGMANGGDSCRGFVCVGARDAKCGSDSCWLGGAAAEWDLILFNFGLHDIERDSLDSSAAHAVEPSAYRQLVANITASLLRKTSKLIYVTTTPMAANWSGSPFRSNDDVQAYNNVAREVVEEFVSTGADISVSDLYDIVVKHCGEGYESCDWQTQPPHFPGHYDPLAAFLASEIRAALSTDSLLV